MIRPRTFDEYQVWTENTASYPAVGTGEPVALLYTMLGITGESGELADKLKKLDALAAYLRTGEGELLVKKELGDVLWYIARLATEMGWTLSDVVETNIKKLEDRKARGVVKGSGDNR